MRAMKASDVVGRRVRIKQNYAEGSNAVSDIEARGQVGECVGLDYKYSPAWPVDIQLPDNDYPCLCAWRELELVEDDS